MGRVTEKRDGREEKKDKVYVVPLAFNIPLTFKVSFSPHLF